MFEFWILRLYVIFFLIAWVYCMHWALLSLRWHRGYMREHGIWNGILKFYNPVHLWPNLKRIRREVPGVKTILKRAMILYCVVCVIQGLVQLYLTFAR